ncbi:MAG: hydrolase [Sporolactobacillus sp.]|jgi:uncharacterized protein|nr:hydrolase [Sporolactobacillus sp.]
MLNERQNDRSAEDNLARRMSGLSALGRRQTNGRAVYLQNAKYRTCVSEFMANEKVLSMQQYRAHGRTNLLEHSLHVSFCSFRLAEKWGWRSRAAARGGLLHDFYLYDWHHHGPLPGPHGFVHPAIALKNAQHDFVLDEREQNIILRHMWPLTPVPPKYKEAVLVSLVDKYCAISESAAAIMQAIRKKRRGKLPNRPK